MLVAMPDIPDALPFCHLVLTSQKRRNSKYPQELRTLGDHIRNRRLDLGLFQKDVAQQIRVHPMTIVNWESNATRPQTSHIPAVIVFLSYDPAGPRSAKNPLRNIAKA
jgi:DNA-binding XRE family transcriptional regulator